MTAVNRTWSYGSLRKVVINTDPAAWEEMDYLLKIDRVVELLAGRTLHVIGEVDMMTSLVRLDDDPGVHILFDQGESWGLVKVATNVTTLMALLDDAALLWVDHQDDCILPTTSDNLQFAQIMLESFVAANPGCDADFWEYQCFAGLNMGFPLG